MSSLAGLSASVTRILSLTGFPKELKTKDIQGAFSEWENVNGGFKIKWRDDTSLLIVFNDASVAKRAYLHTLAYPPAILTASSTGEAATIRPYDGPDAQEVIKTVNTRSQHNPNPSRHNNRSASISVFPNNGAGGSGGRVPSISSRNGNGNNGNGNGNGHGGASSSGIPGVVTIPEYGHPNTLSGREPSPTLPNLPSHPTLNSLISSSLGEAVSSTHPQPPMDPAILATSLGPVSSGVEMGGFSGPTGGPRIGDPGKRMLGAALGVRHPGLGPRGINGAASGGDQGMRDVQRAMGGLVVAE
ncbi:hypothetical protein K435DRAFT_711389 [Dendrothele bispora CBS 962.96]|uniref:Uncharacterized protein n=1 Tax=Dendrothele bispora (strain CBS 962.96) TaxID=1314807 RepID=A0A4S8MTL4_DENBC|nr:hypothetical protein K435DRAFT_711389 [Dendrothele bispora CBS 962.96]